MLILRNTVIYAAFHCRHRRSIRTIHVGGICSPPVPAVELCHLYEPQPDMSPRVLTTPRLMLCGWRILRRRQCRGRHPQNIRPHSANPTLPLISMSPGDGSSLVNQPIEPSVPKVHTDCADIDTGSPVGLLSHFEVPRCPPVHDGTDPRRSESPTPQRVFS